MHHSRERKFTLGIYGDGQLARLLALSAIRNNLSVLIYTLNAASSPCKDLTPLHPGKSWDDRESFFEFCQRCETIALENEFVPAPFLLEAQSMGLRVLPNAESFERIDNKLKQVHLAQSLGIQIPPYKLVSTPADLEGVKLPCVLKSLSGGYDGYGNFSYTDSSQKEKTSAFIANRGPALAQDFIKFDKEVALMVTRDQYGSFTFPVVETIQEDHICHFVLTPPRLSDDIQARIKAAAIKLIEAIDGIGLFGIEFFIRGEEVIFNEIAPRPHNSAHYSIEAMSYSQFDALIKIIQGEKLTTPKPKTAAAAMLNLLGTQNGKARFVGPDHFHLNPQGTLHLYGKEDSRIGRKMGHYTLLGDNQESLLKELRTLKDQYEL